MWTNRTKSTAVLLGLLIATLLIGGAAGAATDPGLGTAASFGVLAGSTVTNTGATTVDGNLGVSPGSAIVGFDSPGGPGTVTPPGTIHANDSVAAQAQTDLTTAYDTAAGSSCDQILTDMDLGGMTLVPGTYCFASSAQLTGALTLNTQANPDAVFIFKIGTTLTTASNSSVIFINGPSCSVYWQIGSSATLGTDTEFTGSILASASITANTGATVAGRLLARSGAVTMDTNTVTKPSCAPAPSPSPAPSTSPTPDVTPTPSPSSGPSPTVIGPDSSVPAGTQINPDDIVFSNAPGSTTSSTATPISSDDTSDLGQSVTLTTTVISGNGSIPTGTVTFIDGSTVVGSAPLDGNGMATLKTSFLLGGDHRITAVYQGSSTISGSISKVFVQKVTTGLTVASDKELPNTGINALPIGLAGTMSILLGFAFIYESRRRARVA